MTRSSLMLALLGTVLCGCSVSPDYEARRHADAEPTTGSMLGPTDNGADPSLEHNLNGPSTGYLHIGKPGTGQ